MINAHCIIFCFGEDFKMKKNRLNSNLPSVIELNGLLSKIGADSNLAKIRQYVSYRSNYLIPNKKFKLQDHSEAMLYRYMTDIEPDVFFDVYLPGYFAFVSPFSILRSFFPAMPSDAVSQCIVLRLLYLLCYLKERYPNECVWFLFHKMKYHLIDPSLLSYELFCEIWREFFASPAIAAVFPEFDQQKINEALERLGIDTAYKRSLIILYVILYRDYRDCERRQKTIEKLRDGFDRIEKFESPQAVFTFQNFDETKPRFLNKLFENTVPENFKGSNWKLDFSAVLKALSGCSLDFLMMYFMPEVFTSISTVIAYLRDFPGGRNHSPERKVIEIICAFLYAYESGKADVVKAFNNYLVSTLSRENISNHKDIFEKLTLLQTSYAVVNHKSESKYKRVYEKGKPALIKSSKPRSEDAAMLDFYMANHTGLVKDTQKLSEMPALNFLIENYDNSKDGKVEDGILFEETANRILYSDVHKVVLVLPSYSFLLRWLSDYRTKNLETTVVIYDQTIVDCLNQKFRENNLISKKAYYSNQSTDFNLQIVNSTDGINEFDLALTFYNKTAPKHEDFVRLSKCIAGQNKLLCVLPHKFFESKENEAVRRDILSAAEVKSVTYLPAILFGYNPRKKYFVEFGMKDSSNRIALRFFEIDKNIHGENANRKKSASGLFFLAIPTEKTLTCNTPYAGDAIDFFAAYTKMNSSSDKGTYNKAQQVSFAPDFKIYYNVTNHGKGKQAKCYFTKYLAPSKKNNGKKDYGAKIDGSRVTVSAQDDDSLADKIIEGFPAGDKFENLRAEAAKEIKLAWKEGRLPNISLFSFAFAYADEIKRYANSFDYDFCYHALSRTSLGSLILKDAMQEDFENAIAALTASVKIDVEKLYRQLEIILNVAVKNVVMNDGRHPVFASIEAGKKKEQKKAQLRDAFTKKSLTFEEEKSLINWLLSHVQEKPAYLGTLIRLFTGMTNPEVSMLFWRDFGKTDYTDCYHLKVSKRRNCNSLKEEALSSSFKYRIVPLPTLLSDLLIAQRDRIQKKYRVPYASLLDLPIVSDSNDNFTDFCSPGKLRSNANKALSEGANIPENIVSLPEGDGSEEHDLSRYNGDFFVSNFKFHALNDAMMTQGELAYILGLVPHDTFSKHYCDYTHPFLQMKLVAKLNDWCSLYTDREGMPLIKTGTTQSDVKSRNITIPPYDSGCVSAQIQLSVKEKCSSAIEVTVAGDRGITGTATVYEEDNNAK